jgi:hypothetical protein
MTCCPWRSAVSACCSVAAVCLGTSRPHSQSSCTVFQAANRLHSSCFQQPQCLLHLLLLGHCPHQRTGRMQLLCRNHIWWRFSPTTKSQPL